jgi:hypothetical protein
MVVVNAKKVVVACYKHVFRVVWNASGKIANPPSQPDLEVGDTHVRYRDCNMFC